MTVAGTAIKTKKAVSNNGPELLVSLNRECQYRCAFCVYLKKKQSQTLSLSKWTSLLRQARTFGFRTLEIGGQGEPTLYKGFSQFIGTAHQQGFSVKLLSNIHNIEKVIEVLPRLNVLTVNMNALSAGEFQRVHAPTKTVRFEDVLSGLVKVIQAIKGQKLSTDLRLSYVIHKGSYIKGADFPEKLFELLKRRVKITKPIRINYHHMLTVPGNYHLCPDEKDLRSMVEAFEKLKDNAFLKANTNLDKFLEHTKKLLAYHRAFGPFTEDSPQDLRRYGAIRKLSHYFWCDACRDMLFIDCNGDVFGCYNPTRMVYGLPKEEDGTYYGNVCDSPLKKLIEKAQSQQRFQVDLTKRFWKVCVICGLKTSWTH